MSIKIKMKVWNVGHGLAVSIESKEKAAMLQIDLGSRGTINNTDHITPRKAKAVSILSPYFIGPPWFATLSEILIYKSGNIHLILSHPHEDHIGGLLDIPNVNFAEVIRPTHIDNLTEEQVVGSNQSLLTEAERSNRRLLIKRYNSLSSLLPRGETFSRGESNTSFTLCNRTQMADALGVESLHTIHPMGYPQDNNGINHHSIITIVETAAQKVVICGDNLERSLNDLVSIPRLQQVVSGASILIAPHHGRESGFSEGFIRCVNPQKIIISDDEDGYDKHGIKKDGYTSILDNNVDFLYTWSAGTNSNLEVDL